METEERELKITDLLKLHEGYSRYPYLDSRGIQTIGIGRNLQAKGISEEEAEYLLGNDITEAIDQLKQKVHCWDGLSLVRKAVLVDMTVNLGIGGFLKFRRMIAALYNKDYEQAAKEMINSLWREQVKARAYRLAIMMSKDEWPQLD